MIDRSWVERARAFAEAAHGEQRYGEEPYVTHLDEVVAILEAFGVEDQEVLAAGYLHDVVEDTPVSEQEVAGAFSERVALIVAFCSDEPGATRKARKAATYARMRATIDRGEAWVEDAVLVKLADRLANMRRSARPGNERLHRIYSEEYEVFARTLNRFEAHAALWAAFESLRASPEP